MWEFFSGKNVLITGGSGFVGTALVYRLASQSPVAHIYLLCRGGWGRLEEKWGSSLPLAAYDALRKAPHITVIEGDMLKPNMDMTDDVVKMLQERIHIVFHSASSINLGRPLGSVIDAVLGGSQNVAEFALGCVNLHRFVFVSTAYVNIFLYNQSDLPEVKVEEDMYPLQSEKTRSLEDELHEVMQLGTSAEYESHEFVWAYAYAKNLTERILVERFDKASAPDKILIVRPSIITPAQLFPCVNFQHPRSCPYTMIAASILVLPFSKFHVQTRLKNPQEEANVDAVPVDVVVDRLLAHLAKGSKGPIHAVSGRDCRTISQKSWDAGLRLRRIPWAIKIRWINLDWDYTNLNIAERVYALFGLSLDFSQGRTEQLWEDLTEVERRGLQLFMAERGISDVTGNAEEIREAARGLLKKGHRARIIKWLFYQ